MTQLVNVTQLLSIATHGRHNRTYITNYYYIKVVMVAKMEAIHGFEEWPFTYQRWSNYYDCWMFILPTAKINAEFPVQYHPSRGQPPTSNKLITLYFFLHRRKSYSFSKEQTYILRNIFWEFAFPTSQHYCSKAYRIFDPLAKHPT